MKKLLFVLLFIPLMSCSQEIIFDELMTINSTDSYKRVVIENGFEFQDIIAEYIWYGFGMTKTKDGDRANKWAAYNEEFGLALFQFFKNDLWIEREYNQIVSDIKSKCEYVEIDGEYVTYNCPESSFNGTIGIMSADGSGFVSIKPTVKERE